MTQVRASDRAPETAIRIHELNHVSLYPRDLEAAVHFYGNVLQLPRLEPPASDFPVAWFALGNQQLHLMQDTMHRDKVRHSHHLALRVEDVVAAQAYLESRGVTVTRGPQRRGDGAMQIWFNDPDGYRLELLSFSETDGGTG